MTQENQAFNMTADDKALEIFYKWNEPRGAFEQDTGWFYEMQAIIKDAVKIGRLTEKGVFCYVEDGQLHIEPQDVTDARKLIRRLTSDMGFMGSPEYTRASKLVIEYERLKQKFDTSTKSE